MSAQGPEAIDDYSKTQRPRTAATKGLLSLHAVAAGLGIAGAILAVVATFSTVIQIVVLTVQKEAYTGLDRYGPALLILAVFALLMVAGAWRGARPAMAALALAGVVVLAIVALIDIPHINDKGVWPEADLYEDAQASAGTGFYFETASGVLMLLSGVLMLLLGPRNESAPRSRREPGPTSRPGAGAEGGAPPEPAARAASDDWFAEPPRET